MNDIFIGSSSRGLKHAQALREHIDVEFQKRGMDTRCDLWRDPNMFLLSMATIESLGRIANHLKSRGGYAILLFTPDDLVTLNKGISVKEVSLYAPRDNVVFELGLFMGMLGRAHTFCVCPSNINIRLLSDWQGVTNATYHHAWTRNIRNRMKDPAEVIVSHILAMTNEKI